GSYGRLNAQTGRFDVEGNVHDPEFQKLLDATDGKLKLSDHPPVFDEEGKDFAAGSMGVRISTCELLIYSSLENLSDFCYNSAEGLDQAKYKGDWQFLDAKQGAMLVMYKPIQEHFIKGKVFEALYKVLELKDTYIVPSVYKCRTYALYLSERGA
ncbi:hypothetical protein EDD22DRAFT_756673, partial [Suillus occidentalis]